MLLLLLLRLTLFLALSGIASSSTSHSVIKSLPGYSGDFPFKLETGYVGVGDSDEVQLFYYFIESERSPGDDPLMLWLTGGPGCSGLSGLMYEIGPFTLDYANSSGTNPTLELNPYAWTKVANIIFLDSPVGTGFSYAKTAEAYYTSDTIASAQIYSFMRKWLMDHEEFLDNPLYISGDSYSGITVPIVVQEIFDGNGNGLQPAMNLKGYVLGNPYTDSINDLNSRVPYAHRVVILSDDLYNSTATNCDGMYVDVHPDNQTCVEDLQWVQECIEKINQCHILEPKCESMAPKPNALKWDRNALEENPQTSLPHSVPPLSGPWCRQYNYYYVSVWANDIAVRDALHVRKGTKQEWHRCNGTLDMTSDVLNTVSYHKNLTRKLGLRALVYSGDHDMVIPYVGTQEWIKILSLPIIYGWKPWFVDGEVAGYTEKYANDLYALTFATVKGAGHTAPEYKGKECLAMISRWLAHFYL